MERTVLVHVLHQLGVMGGRVVRDADIKRAAVLHLDVALLVDARATGPLLRGAPRQRPQPSTENVLAFDGRREGRSQTLTHLEFARLLLRELPGDASRDAFVPLWYAASAAFLSANLNFAELQRHLAEGRRVLPDDPQVLTASGYLHEVFSGSRTQALVRDRRNESLLVSVGGERTNITQAAIYLDRAVDRAPRLAEARLRFGRVLSRQGRYADALPHLEIALKEAGDAEGKYYALLFLGRALEAQDRDEEARLRFEEASRLFPRAQSPPLALSRLALARGDQQEAERLIARVPDVVEQDIDPWWIYERGSGRQAARMADDLAAAVRALER